MYIVYSPVLLTPTKEAMRSLIPSSLKLVSHQREKINFSEEKARAWCNEVN